MPDMARSSGARNATAVALARMVEPSRTSRGSSNSSRRCFRAWLTADWVTLSFCADFDTLSVLSSASNTLRRLRSRLARFTGHQNMNTIHDYMRNQ
jgi:hypothetical protein